MRILHSLVCLTCLASLTCPTARAWGADPKPTEADYYQLVTCAIPDGIVLEAGGLQLLPNGRLAVATRRGEIYLVDNADTDRGDDVKFHRFAHGLTKFWDLSFATVGCTPRNAAS